MGAGTERIAVEVTSRSDVGGLRNARQEIGAMQQSSEALRKTEEALTAETRKLTTDTQTMGRLLQQYGGDLQKAAQEAARLAQIEKQVADAVAPTTRQLQQQTTVLREQAVVMQKETTQALTALERRIGSTSVAVVFGMESMVRGFASGESGVRAALRSIGVLAATTMGPQGIAIAALIAFGDAAFEHLTRARKEMEATRKTFETVLARMVNAGDQIGLQKQLRELEVGLPSAGVGEGGGFKGSMRDLIARQNQAVADFETADRTFNLKLLNDAKRRLAELKPQIAEQKKERDTLIQALLYPPISAGANATRDITGLPGMTTTAGGGRSVARQLALDMEVYAEQLRNVLGEATKLRDVQIGMIGQDQLTPLQLMRAEEGRLELALRATNLTYAERIRLQRELANVREDEAQARKVIGIDPKTVEKQAKDAMDRYKKSRQGVIDEDVAEEEKKRQESARRIATVIVGAAETAIRAGEPLSKMLTRMALEPLEKYLEGLAIKEATKAIEHGAAFDFAGAALHAAAAAAALTAAHEVAALGGLGGGGGHGARGGAGGTFTPRGEGGGGDINLTVQTIDESGRVLREVAWHLNREQTLKRPIVPPPQRSA